MTGIGRKGAGEVRQKRREETGGFVFVRFLWQVLTLAGVSLIIRACMLRFNLRMSEELGNSVMGMIELILSVRAFFLTFSCAGVNLAASRLCAEEMESDSGRGVREVMRRCLLYAGLMSAASGLVLYLLSDFIALTFLGQAQAAPALRLLAFGLPFASLSAAIAGYFSAMRRAERGAMGDLISMAVRIALTMALIQTAPGSRQEAYLCVVVGIMAAEGFGMLWEGFLYAIDLNKHVSRQGRTAPQLNRRLLSITAPLAMSSYVRTGLVTLEHMLIPWGLRQSGADFDASLAAYGILSGMALPILFFPASFSGAANSLLLPEVARAAAAGKEATVSRIAARLLSFTILFGVGVAGCLLCFAPLIGTVLYHERSVGTYLLYLAPLVPVMYFDTAVDSVLKGLGEQVFTMGVNIIDAALSAFLVFLLVPRMGILGYVTVIILSEAVNATLSFARLIRKSRVRLRICPAVLLPLLSALGAGVLTRLFLARGSFESGIGIAVGMAFFVGCYLLLAVLLGWREE